MLQIIISGKQYEIPDKWEDVTMRQLINSQRLLKEMPEKLSKITFPESEKDKPPKLTEKDEIEFLAYYLRWFEYWTNIPDAKKIHIDDLKAAYEVLQVFMFMPIEFESEATIEFKGVTYMLPSIEKLMSGDLKYMANATYEVFVEGMQLSSGLNKLHEGDLSSLQLLTATYYREQVEKGFLITKTEAVAYDEEGTKRRAEIFLDLPMDKVWGAYFFLCNHLEKSLTGLQTSLKEKVQGIASLKDLAGI